MEAYVVRLWTPADDAPRNRQILRGTALHVASGVARVFSDPTELLEFLSSNLLAQARQPRPAATDSGHVADRGDAEP